MAKYVGFRLDGVPTMVGKNTWVATLLKKVNPFFTWATHCIAHLTNLTTLEASMNESCKRISIDVDYLLNSLAILFKKIIKRLSVLPNKLNDAQIILKRYKIKSFDCLSGN